MRHVSIHPVLLVLAVGSTAAAHPTHPTHPTYTLGQRSVKRAAFTTSPGVPPPTDTMPFGDDFDTYLPGQMLSIAGKAKGWELWNVGSPDHLITKAGSFSPPNALSTAPFGDNVQLAKLDQFTTGDWRLRAKVYMPSSQAGTGGAWIIGLNTFERVSSSNNWSVQIAFDSVAVGEGLIGNSGPNSVPVPMVYDQWIDVEIYIDLDADTCYAQVDTGSGFQKVIDPPSSWSNGSSGGGKVAIECWDFYSAGATGFLYDDISFGPGTPPCYTDADDSGELDIDDFVAFQTAYALNDPYADCDGSLQLDISDFLCFQTLFAIGC